MNGSARSYLDMLGDAVASSWRRTGRLLFQGFSWRRWLAFAFGAWLANLGGTPHVNIASNWGSPPESIGAWVRANTALLMALAAVAIVVGFALTLVVMWINSRGQFVFLHGVATGVPAIGEPWTGCVKLGNSLFLWRLGFWLLVLVCSVLLAGAGIGGAVVLQTQPVLMVFTIVLVACAVLALIIGVAVTASFLTHFVTPLMYRYAMPCTAAWRYFLRLCRVHASAFLLFLMANAALRIGAAVIGGAIAVWLALMTCCICGVVFAIPLVGGFAMVALLLPVHVFFRCFGVYFLEQFHPDYQMMMTAPD